MFKNFSSLDRRSIFLVYYYRPYFRKKKKKKHFFRTPFQRFAPDIPIENKTKQNKNKNPLKNQLFTSLHTLVHLWILLSAREGTLGKCSYWEGLAYE